MDKLFTMYVSLDPYNEAVLDKGAQSFTVLKDGTALTGRFIAGSVKPKQWDYIKSLGTVDTLRRCRYNEFEADVFGEVDRSKIFPDPHDRPHIYKCGRLDHYPPMIPGEEYYCEIVPDGDLMDVYVGDEHLGKYAEKYGRTDQIKKWLEKGYQSTAQIELHSDSCSLFLILRKKK